VKISVSLPDSDVVFIDRFAAETGETRSGALHRAIRSLRYEILGEQYAAAFAEGSPWDAPVPDEPTG
jgi:Arc/MetJ-type ribon-helix-helix transcriptional regulator